MRESCEICAQKFVDVVLHFIFTLHMTSLLSYVLPPELDSEKGEKLQNTTHEKRYRTVLRLDCNFCNCFINFDLTLLISTCQNFIYLLQLPKVKSLKINLLVQKIGGTKNTFPKTNYWRSLSNKCFPEF